MWTETTRVQYQRDELAYASSTRAGEWAQIAALLPPPCRLGRPRRHDLRLIVDAILYLLWTGCQWRALPREFPPRSTVQRYLYCWRDDGTWARISAALVARARQQAGRNPAPSAAIIDSQSVPTTESGGPRGVDAGKRIKGRKRHIVTDSEGFLLAVRVHEANIQGPARCGAPVALVAASLPPARPRLRRPRLPGRTTARRDRRLRPMDDRDRPAPARRQRLPAPAAALGGRANLRLARPQPPPRQGLRGQHRQRHRLGVPCQPAPPHPSARKCLNQTLSFRVRL